MYGEGGGLGDYGYGMTCIKAFFSFFSSSFLFLALVCFLSRMESRFVPLPDYL